MGLYSNLFLSCLMPGKLHNFCWERSLKIRLGSLICRKLLSLFFHFLFGFVAWQFESNISWYAYHWVYLLCGFLSFLCMRIPISSQICGICYWFLNSLSASFSHLLEFPQFIYRSTWWDGVPQVLWAIFIYFSSFFFPVFAWDSAISSELSSCSLILSSAYSVSHWIPIVNISLCLSYFQLEYFYLFVL